MHCTHERKTRGLSPRCLYRLQVKVLRISHDHTLLVRRPHDAKRTRPSDRRHSNVNSEMSPAITSLCPRQRHVVLSRRSCGRIEYCCRVRKNGRDGHALGQDVSSASNCVRSPTWLQRLTSSTFRHYRSRRQRCTPLPAISQLA